MPTHTVSNPYIYSFSTRKNTYVYLPYKQTLAKFGRQEWENIKNFNVSEEVRKQLEARKIYVGSNYKEEMLRDYRKNFIEEVTPSPRIMYPKTKNEFIKMEAGFVEAYRRV